MDRLFIVALFALAWIQKINGVEQFVFHGPTEEMVEVPGISMEYPIDISRTSDIDAELLVANTITLTSNCPAGVTPTASSSDYSVKLSGAAAAATLPLDVEFVANDKQMTVIVTINDDSTYEGTEIFCMSIQPDNIAGSQNTITVSIPENDFCYEKNIPGTATDYTVANAIYAGPWTPSIDNTVDITVTPETGTDITIFLATNTAPDPAATPPDFYAIVFDDTPAGTTHGGAMSGDTQLFQGNPATANFQEGLFTDADGNADVLADGVPYSFWLRYTSGKIEGGLQSNRADVLFEFTDPDLPKLVIKHIFVQSSANTGTGPAAKFEICHLCPKKITPVGAVQNMGGGNPMRAIDGGIGPDVTTNNCFVTSPGTTDPWLRIDLGKVYDVTDVLIWPVTMDTAFGDAAAPANIDDAKVYVGNCPSDQITDNIECFDVGSKGTTGDDPIEDACTLRGQYVYIYKTGSTQFSFCEVEIYGKEVPYGEDTTVQFQEAGYEVNENVGTYTINAFRTYPSGVSPTCTSVEYYSDRTVIPASGDSNDFTPIPPIATDANLKHVWLPSDVSGTGTASLLPITLTIIEDTPGLCEPVETFNVYLTNIVGGIAGTPTSTAIRIMDTDSVIYGFTMASYNAVEGTSFNIGVLRTGDVIMQPGTAGLIFTDVTTTSSDYTRAPTSVSFNSDTDLTVPANVPVLDDEIYDPKETLTVSLGELTPNADGCSTIDPIKGTATLMITDNDSEFKFNVGVDATTIVITEGQSRTIEITREGNLQQKDVDIVIYEGGTDQANLGNDFTIIPSPAATTPPASRVTFNAASTGAQEITINTVDDSELEGVETFILTLRDPLYTLGNRADPYSLTISIVDNDAEYFWKQNSYSVTEGGALQVCIIRTGQADKKSIVITTVSGTAVAGSDFTAIPQIEFEAGLYEACAPVPIAVDTVPEQTKTFMMQISSGQDIVTNTLTDKTSVSIVDDDTVISFSQPTYTFREGQSGLSVMISKTGNPSVSFTLTITPGTATQNNDFILNVGSSSSLTIPTGTTSLTLPITIINDGLVEQAEQFTLTISGASGGTISTPTATITITDNDVSTPIPPITTPTTTADSGIGGAAIAAIAVSAAIGAIITIIAIVIFCVMLSGANAAASATAGASATAAANSFPLTNYPPGYNNAINGLDSGFGGTRTSYNPYYM